MKKFLAAVAVLLAIAVPSAPLIGQTTNKTSTSESEDLKLEPAEIVSTVDPVYPPKVVRPGTVVMDVLVGASGEIQNVKIIRSDPGFEDAAMAAIHEWKFKPATINGKAIPSVVPVAFSFSQPLLWKQ